MFGLRRLIFILLFAFVCIAQGYSSEINGVIKDGKTNELLVGATVYVKELKIGVSSGLDGSYKIKGVPKGNYTVACYYLSYNTVEYTASLPSDDAEVDINYSLNSALTEVEEVTVVAHRDLSSDISARSSEKESLTILNIVSAKSIELSPDLNVANVVQRMSGVTLDKSSANSGQYAMLRGMDKRYSYTLVNGVKIPSTNNKHRYISLDMFPSDLVDRVEVTKSLTPNMEGDAVAGVINMVMKNAPDRFLVMANGSMGYSQYFSNNSYNTFNTSVLNPQSPYERNDKGYRAIPSDFPTNNMAYKSVSLPLNYFGNLTLGNRAFDKKLGWIVSGSIQNSYNGLNSLYFKDDLSRDGNNLPIITSMQERVYTENKKNYGVHAKLDYELNARNRFQFYSAYLLNNSTQIREVDETDLAVSYDPQNGTVNSIHSTRFRYNSQSLFNSTLQSDHQITDNFSAQWSAVYSKALNETPDETTVGYYTGSENFIPAEQYVDFDGSDRIWRRNSDEDIAGYLSFAYKTAILDHNTEFKFGGMYRDKQRTSFYNKYTLQAIVNVSNSDTTYTSFYSAKNSDWFTYDQINWKVYNPRGTVAVGENYDAYETVSAAYAMFCADINKLQVTGGVRFENTTQGYSMLYPIGEAAPEGSQSYVDVLPSLHFKYAVKPNQNLRLSYYRAVNKPGFQEIVPFIDASEEPNSAGNKDLKHAVADNIDARWEYFPSQLDQIMVGLFYKNMKDPIEFAFNKFMNVSQQIVYTPINSDKAVNYGLEVDVTKFYREFGINANYTYTQSTITSMKLSRGKDAQGNDLTTYVSQSRPLFGQSAHVGNVSLLYKNSKNGMSGQLAFSYTGERIYTVSRFIDNDHWQKGYWQVDASAEKKFKYGISLFVKAQNILNNHLKVYIKNANPMNGDTPYHSVGDTNTLIRDDQTKPAYLIGFRYKY